MGTRSQNALILMANHLCSITSAALRRLDAVAHTITDQGAVAWTWETNISPFYARTGVFDLKEEVEILEWVLSLPKAGFKFYRVGEDGGSLGDWEDHPLKEHQLLVGVLSEFAQQEAIKALPPIDLNLMADISTGHIPKHTADALGPQDAKEKPALYDKLSYLTYHEYGWIVHCSNEQEIEADHPELANLIPIARALGAEHIKLDTDCRIIPGLPVFKW